MGLQTIDWIIIVAYAVFVIAVGLTFARRAGRSTSEFFLSGRSLPWWISGTSMVATSFAADTPLLISGWVRDQGIWMNWQWWCFAVGGMLTVFLFARYWRRAEVLTAAELTEIRYGDRGADLLRGFLGIAHSCFINTIVLCWVLLAATKIMDVLFGLDVTTSLIIACLLGLNYSPLAGFWGVVVTDLVQFTMAIIGAIWFAVIVWGKVGGIDAVRESVGAMGDAGKDILRFVPQPGETASGAAATLWQAEFWTYPVAALAVYLGVSWWATYGVDGGPIGAQRISASKTPRDGMFGTLWYNLIHYSIRPWPWIAVGLASLVVLPVVKIDAPVTGRITAIETRTELPEEMVVSRSEAAGDITFTALTLESALVSDEGQGVRLSLEADPTQSLNDQMVRVRQEAVSMSDPFGLLVVTDSAGNSTEISLSELEPWGEHAPGFPADFLGREVELGDALLHTDSERAYVVMMLQYLPAGLLGLVVASLLAAFLSTIDTHVNLASSFYVNDVHRRFIHPKASNRELIIVSRIASVVVLAAGAIMAANSDSISDLFKFFLAFLAGLGPVYLARWIWWRVTALTEIVAMSTSMVLTVFLSWSWLHTQIWGGPIPWNLGVLTPDGALSGEGRILLVISCSLIASSITLLIRKPDPQSLVPFYEKVRPIGFWGPVRKLSDAAPPPGEGRAVVTGVVSGITLTYSFMFTLGFILLGERGSGAIAGVITLVAGTGVFWAVRELARREPSLEN